MPRSESFCARTVDRADTTIFEDPSQHPELRANPWVTGDDGVRFYAGQPLRRAWTVPRSERCASSTTQPPRHQLSAAGDARAGSLTWWRPSSPATDELDRAAEVQRSLLPRRSPDLAGYDVAGVCLPASAIGGDFYDWYPVDEATAGGASPT